MVATARARFRPVAMAGIAAVCAFAAAPAHLPSASAAQQATGSPAYLVVGPTEKVLRTAAATGSPAASLMGARNEFLSFQVVLPGGSEGQNGVTVGPGHPLTGASGAIPNAAVTIYREAYYVTTQPSAGQRAVGGWPDALIPTVDTLYGQARKAFPVDVAPNENQLAFVDVLVPATQPAGGYDGTVLVSDTGGASVDVPIHLDVSNFTLQSTSSLRSLYRIDWRAGCDALYPPPDHQLPLDCAPFASNANEERAWRTNYDFARLALDDRISLANSQFQPPANAGRSATSTLI